MSDLRELYQQTIIDHGRSPRNVGELPSATFHREGFNPLCGDKIVLQLEAAENIIRDVRFEGSGCAISMASASLLTEVIKGKTIAEATNIFNDFQKLMTEGTPSDRLGKLQVLSGVREFPSRVKCAVLAWHTLRALWFDDGIIVSTE